MSNRHHSLLQVVNSGTSPSAPFQFVVDTAHQLSQQICHTITSSAKGQLFFVYGPVNSGKSLMLCELADQLKQTQIPFVCLQPDLDRQDLTPNNIVSSDGHHYPAQSISSKQQLFNAFKQHKVVIIDEVQFLDPSLHSFFLQITHELVSAGGFVVTCGLRYTALQSEFTLSAALVNEAHETHELAAVCSLCHKEKAYRNQRLDHGQPTVQWAIDVVNPTSEITYEPRCSKCLITQLILAEKEKPA